MSVVGSGKRQRTRQRWTLATVYEVKSQILAELAPLENEAAARIAKVMAAIVALEGEDDATARLRCLVYVMTALNQHQNHRCLKPTQVEGLVLRADILLRLQGIVPRKSNLSFLFGELHLVRSLIHRRDGQQWQSAWEQQMAEFLSADSAAFPHSFQALSLATRALRLGSASVALRELARATTDDLDRGRRDLVTITKVRALRLSGAFEEASAIVAATLAQDDAAPQARAELRWELICLERVKTQDHREMIVAVTRDPDHRKASYIAEAFLWAAAAPTHKWRQGMLKMSTLARRDGFRPRGLGFFLDAALTIERCYDTEIPLTLRLDELGRVLGKLSQLVNIDKEMLLWISAARWLTRIHSFKLASLALAEYEWCSRRLTNGANPDVLAIAGDLLLAPWYLSGQESGEGEESDDALPLPISC